MKKLALLLGLFSFMLLLGMAGATTYTCPVESFKVCSDCSYVIWDYGNSGNTIQLTNDIEPAYDSGSETWECEDNNGACFYDSSVTQSNFTLDCNGHRIFCSGSSCTGCSQAIYLRNWSNVIIKNCIIEGFPLSLYFGVGGNNVTFYNTIFNTTDYIGNSTNITNIFFNTTQYTATNIVNGSEIGGNFWAYPNGTGYSETCVNNNNDSFCDSAYSFSGYISYTVDDYLPLTYGGGGGEPETTHYCDSCVSCNDIATNGTAQDGDTLQITNNISFSGDSYSNCINIGFNNGIIDFMGHTLSGNCGEETEGCGMAIYSAGNANVTIKNGVFTGAWFPMVIISGGVPVIAQNFIVDNCVFNLGNGEYESRGIGIANTSQVIIKNNVFRKLSGFGVIEGIYSYDTGNMLVINNTFIDLSAIGFEPKIRYNITFTRNVFYNANLNNLNRTKDSFFYDNIFNSSSSYLTGEASDSSNMWNITATNGTNIIGGSQIGGNYWAYPNGTGYSETCVNNNNDSFCDSSYTFNPTDYLPLTLNTGGDTTPPTITITSPTSINYTTTTIALDVSADEPTDAWWYSLNGGANTTFTPNTTIAAVQGANDLIAYANDTAGNIGEAGVSFFVDSIAPDITWNTPANNSVTQNSSAIYWNVTIGETPDTCLLNLNGTLNITMNKNGNYCYYNYSGANATTIRGMVYANDTFGNMNLSSERWVTINLSGTDLVPPNLTIVSPTAITYTTSDIALTVSANEPINTWWYNLNGGANTSFTPNTTISGLASGVYTLTIYANDLFGNVGMNSAVFTVQIPVINNLGMFAPIAGIAIGGGFLLFIIGLFLEEGANLARDPKKLAVIAIGILIVAVLLSALFV